MAVMRELSVCQPKTKRKKEKLLGEAQTSWSKVIDTCKANLLKLQQEISTLADRSFTLWQSSGKDEKAGKLVDIVEKYGIQKKELFEKHAGIIYRLQTAKSGMENNPDSKQMGNIKKLVEEAQTNINNFGGMNVDCVKSVEALSNALSNAKIPAELDKLELKEEEEREEINRLSNIQI